MNISDDLEKLDQVLTESRFEIDHYELRKSKVSDKPSERKVAEDPADLLEDLEGMEDKPEEYVIEAFIKDSLDRIIYQPSKNEISYLGFGNKTRTDSYTEELKELLED